MEREEFINKYKKARRSAIEHDFMRLNKMQREAVLTTDGPLLLLAGAGSGKTTVLINRIANLLKYGNGSDSNIVPDWLDESDLLFLQDYIKTPTPDHADRICKLCSSEPVEPWRIIAITFTNKAANEMKNRLVNQLGSSAEDIWAMTFHSACVRILRRDIELLGYDRSFTIYDSTDSASLMRRILKELETDEKSYPYRTVLNQISRAKDAMLNATGFCDLAENQADIRKRMIGQAYLEYENRLKTANALDFDDIILLTVRLFKEHPDTLEYYQKKFKYVMIDEYQDTNKLQYLLASFLAAGHGNICVVGDDDQSIYKFRGATIENILNFEKKYKNARVIRLEQNYRSNGYILDAANDVISCNKGRKGKKLWTENEKGEKPLLKASEDERFEAQFVADSIMTNVANGRKWQDNAVLFRMNAQSNQFETVFRRNAIPYRVVGGTGFYDRMEIRDMLAYLCAINNPMDDLRLLRIINTPTRGIGQATIGHLLRIAGEENKSIYEIMMESEKYPDTAKSAGRLHKFADMIADLQTMEKTAPLDALYDELIMRSGYMRMLQEKGSDENISRIENVNELKTNIIAFMRDNGGSLLDFLNDIALYTDLDSYDSGSDCVVLMTMHSAKGLEFDTVFIVGAEEGIFPSNRVIGNPEEMEEERRLCYVAMTRAKRRLYFTSARRRMLFGKTTACTPSRFISEIDKSHIELPGGRTDKKSAEYNSRYNQPGKTVHIRTSTMSSADNSTKHLKKTLLSTAATTSSVPLPDFKQNDIVVHKAFGRGKIISLTRAGNDALIEVDFDDNKSGTKRLMLKSAAKYMERGIEN